MNETTKQVTDAEIQFEVCHFLHGAGDHDGGRKQRAEQKAKACNNNVIVARSSESDSD